MANDDAKLGPNFPGIMPVQTIFEIVGQGLAIQ